MKFGMLVNTQDPPDGARIPQLYDEILAEARLAEDVGFDALFVPEHHMVPDGYMCAPLLFLAAVAAQTKRIRLGTSIAVLPSVSWVVGVSVRGLTSTAVSRSRCWLVSVSPAWGIS